MTKIEKEGKIAIWGNLYKAFILSWKFLIKYVIQGAKTQLFEILDKFNLKIKNLIKNVENF